MTNGANGAGANGGGAMADAGGGRPPVPAKFVASPVAFGGNLYLTSMDGDTFVVRAGPTHEIVRTNELGEPVYASLAPAQGRLLIRGRSHLYCIKAA